MKTGQKQTVTRKRKNKKQKCLPTDIFTEVPFRKWTSALLLLFLLGCGGPQSLITKHVSVELLVHSQHPVQPRSVSDTGCGVAGDFELHLTFHNPSGTWAHLSLVLDMVREKYLLISCSFMSSVTSHIPNTKLKKSFWKKKKFKDNNWNFFEASYCQRALNDVCVGVTLKISWQNYIMEEIKLVEHRGYVLPVEGHGHFGRTFSCR